MFKNVIIAVLAAACVFLAVSLYAGSGFRSGEEISPAEYGGLLNLKNVFPAAEYRERVQPLLREAFVDGRVTRERLRILGEKLNDVGARTLKTLEGEPAGEKVSRAWDSAKDSAAALGESIGRHVDEAMRELGDAVEGLKPRGNAGQSGRSGVSVDL